jgi:hypothetical protein
MQVPKGRLSLATMLFVAVVAGSAFAQDARVSRGVEYVVPAYVVPWGQSISTPTMTLDNPVLEVGARNATEGNIAGATNATLSQQSVPAVVDYPSIYYGYRPVLASSETEESMVAPAAAGGFRSGIGRFRTAADLHYFGYGLPLADAAREAKANRKPATRSFTNEDIDRLAHKQ